MFGHHLQTREAPLRGKSTAVLSFWEEGAALVLQVAMYPLLSMAHLTWSFYFGSWNRMLPMKLSLGSSPVFELPVKFPIRSKSNDQLAFTPRAPADQGKHITIPSSLLPSSKTQSSRNSLNTNAVAGWEGFASLASESFWNPPHLATTSTDALKLQDLRKTQAKSSASPASCLFTVLSYFPPCTGKTAAPWEAKLLQHQRITPKEMQTQ